MKKLVPIPIAVLVLLGIVPFTGLMPGEPPGEPALVTRVIDGDTVELANGERVRLLGLDTPETGQPFYQQSKTWLRARLEDQTVTLEPGPEDKDKYGRLLRYIWLGDRLVNLELVELGLGAVYMMEPEEAHYQDFLQAESRAREAGLGIWQHPGTSFCVGIHYFHYNAEGDDNENLNDEYVTFRNKCTHPVELTGWTLQDTANNTYTFPELALANKTTVTLHTGPGQDNSTDLYWGRTRAVWNNQADTLWAWNAQGELLLNHSYKLY